MFLHIGMLFLRKSCFISLKKEIVTCLTSFKLSQEDDFCPLFHTLCSMTDVNADKVLTYVNYLTERPFRNDDLPCKVNFSLALKQRRGTSYFEVITSVCLALPQI